MDNNPVTIIVKASNQQFEDQTVRCELSWTIKRLKGLLSEVYPSKPMLRDEVTKTIQSIYNYIWQYQDDKKSDEQKLIYSGQLLNDTIVLKDILRQYEGQDTHTVHLVLQPKNKVFETARPNKINQMPMQQPVTTDGLRQRNITQANSGSTVDEGLFRPSADWSNNFVDRIQNTETEANYNAWATQNMTSYNMMLEQIYRQYYNQYMNTVNQPNLVSQNGGANNLPQMPYYPQNYFASPIYNSPLLQQQNNDQPQQAQVPQPAPPQQQVPQQPLPEQQPNPAQQRFPNIVQEEVENRDWLDMFYAFSRLMVLVTLVYFYSSPLRCLIVIFFTILYYGYHVGYFRQFNREPNNNQPPHVAPPNNNENAAAPAPIVEQQPRNDVANNEENPANEAEPLVNQVASPTDNDDANNDNNRTPVIVLVRTFIMSFFASFIPETPAL